jgi:predicted dehydrogenase
MINIGIIGCGSFGAAHLQTIKSLPNLSVIAACRTNKEKLTAFCFKHKVKGYTDYRELLKSADIDAVVIATPHHLHFKIALKAIEAGKHLLIEKPMAHSVDACIKITKAAQKAHVKLMVGQTLRFHPASLFTSKLIKENSYGSIIMGTALFSELWNSDVRKPWHLELESFGGILNTISVHYVDFLNSLVQSKVKSVFASVRSSFGNYETDDAATLVLRYHNGVEAVIICNGYQQGSDKIEVEIYHEKAIVKIDYAKGVYISKDQKKTKLLAVRHKEGMQEALSNQWIEFRNAIIANRMPLVSGEDGTHTIEIMEAAHKSSRLGSCIHLD